MRSYDNAERGLSRVNNQLKQNNMLTGIFKSRWTMIGGAILGLMPLLVRLSGSLVQVVASLAQAVGGAGVIGGGALGAFIVGLGSVVIAAKGVMEQVKASSKALDAYNTAVRQHGAASQQAARAQRELNNALKQAPKGTLGLLQGVKALKKEWQDATAHARDYIVATASYGVSRLRGAVPQIAGIVNRNVGAVANVSRGMIDRLLDPNNLAILERISRTFRRDLPPAADALLNIVFSFGRLTADAGPFVRRFLVDFDKWTQRLDVATRDTTYMQYRMRGLVAEFRNWLRFLQATYGLLRDVFRAATVTHSSLHGITQQFREWSRWIERNPLKMQRFFDASKQGAHDLGAALMFVLRLIGRMSTGLDPLWQSIRSLLAVFAGPLLDLLTQALRLVAILGSGLAGLGGPVSILMRTMAGFLRVLNEILSRVPFLGSALAGALAIAGVLAMIRGMRSFGVNIAAAVRNMFSLRSATQQATLATEDLAAASRLVGGGAVSGRRGGGSGGGGGPGGYGGPVILPPGVRSVGYVPPAAAVPVGRLGRMRAGLGGMRGMGALRSVGGPAAITALLGTTALSMVPGMPSRVSGAATGASMGAMGFMAGPEVGIPATLIGAALGAAFGGGGGGGDSAQFRAYEQAMSGTDRTVGAHRGVIGGGRGGLVYGQVGGRTVHRGGIQERLAALGGEDPHTIRQVAGQLTLLRRARRMLAGDTGAGATTARAMLGAEIQSRAAVLPGMRATRRHREHVQGFTTGQGLMRGFNVMNRAEGPVAGMEFVRQQALARWARLGPEGKRVLANGLLSWADQMRKANPELAGQFEALKNSIIGKFVTIGGKIHQVHGQILTGTKTEWRAIARSMESPVEQARQAINRSFDLIQQKAVGSLEAMGFTPQQAAGLVMAMERGGAAGKMAGQVAAGQTGYGAFTGISSGGAQSASRHRGGPKNNAVTGNGAVTLQPGIQSVAAQVLAAFPGLSVTSTVRPGDVGSYHSVGEAVDVAGPPSLMNQAARWIAASMGGSLLEGIHQSGLSIKNGEVVPPSFWGASTWAGHANHIHLAAGRMGAGGARGNMNAMTTRGAGVGAMIPGRSGIGGLPGLLVDATGLSVAGATAARLNTILKGGGVNGAVTPVAAASNTQALAQQMALQRGWGGAEWNALHSLWMGESGFNTLAKNKSSGAYGIPQALPGSKMATAGADWQTNPATQIAWGLGYIGSRYGTPSAAYAAWSARSPHWYGDGGHFVARRPQLIGVGDKGDEEVLIRPMRNRNRGLSSATGGGIHVAVHIGRIDATGSPGAIREQVRGEIRDALADVASEIERAGFVPDEDIT